MANAKGPPKLTPSRECLAIMQRNLVESPLLRLPTELRFMIYEFAIDTHSEDFRHGDFQEWDRLEFCRASRQLFAETACDYFDRKIMYLRREGLDFDDKHEMGKTVDRLTPSQRNAVTSIGMTLGVLAAITCCGELDDRALVLLPNLDSLVWLDTGDDDWYEFNYLWDDVKHGMENDINVSMSHGE